MGVDDLTCSIDSLSGDPDGDSIVYDFAWIDPTGVTQQTTMATASLSLRTLSVDCSCSFCQYPSKCILNMRKLVEEARTRIQKTISS